MDTSRVLDLGPRTRVVFGAVWLAAQAVAIATAGNRPDFAFGFRMFNESSTLDVHLFRRVDSPTGHGTVLVPVANGEWIARDRDGQPHRIKWRDRVREPALAVFDRPIHASYGAGAQLARFQAAIDDVAAHIPEDAETRALVAEVDVRKNGREPYQARLTATR
jgi:hypothetical protein